MPERKAEPVSAPCIVVANEPRAYREALARAFRVRRPDVPVFLAEPGGLDRAVLDRAPAVVVCSALSAVVRTRPRTWIVLYPGGEDRAVLSVAGVRRTFVGVELDALLATIDETLHPA
jgi:hypothetical protein